MEVQKPHSDKRTYQDLGFNVAAMPTLLGQMTVPEERHI
jgi:hypothetical protein